MAPGPILIFDKSALQALTVDESVMLDHFFLTNITPVFFVETLADLEKEDPQGRPGEKLVRDLASKMPDDPKPNIFHRTLLVQDLLGNPTPMTGQILLAGGVAKPDGLGGVSVVFEEAPEAEAVRRWKAGEFAEVERLYARTWRASIASIDPTGKIEMARRLVPIEKPMSLEAAKEFADSFVARASPEVVMFATQYLGVPDKHLAAIDRRFTAAGRPPFQDFAPYAAFVLAVDLVFYLSTFAPGRRTNSIDLSYLYYLPFCMVFTSKDNLHRELAPRFMRPRQRFAWGEDLKAGVKRLNEYYAQFREEIDRVGLVRYAPRPPEGAPTIVTDLWEQCLRLDGTERKAASGSAAAEAPSDSELLERIKRIMESKERLPQSVGDPQPNSVIMTSQISPRRGSWRLLPEGIEDKASGGKEEA